VVRRADVEVSSRLDAAPDEVWRWIVTPEGVNDELRPWLRMTVPGGDFDLRSVEIGKPIGRSWVLLTDAIAWEPRLPLPGAAMRPLFRALFGHRHRRLRRRFGGVPAPPVDGS
jgi:hypothetical protein